MLSHISSYSGISEAFLFKKIFKNVVFNGEEGIEKSVPWDHPLSSSDKACDAIW